MDELPNEILLKIFKSSLPVDQILLCKQVCKRWYWVIDSLISLRSLVLIDGYHFPILSRWFETNEFVYDCRYQIRSRKLEVIEFRGDQPMFSNLKRLFICNRTVAINTINQLSQLEVLEIRNSKSKDKKQINISLPNLRVLSLGYIRGTVHDIVIDAPKLEKFEGETYFPRITVKHPESIREYYSQGQGDLICELVNLEHIYTDRYWHREETLLKLKHLKSLHFNSAHTECLVSLKAQKASLKKSDLQIYFLGVHLDAFPLANLDINDWHAEIYYYDHHNFGYRMNAKTIDFYGSNYLNLCDKLYYVQMLNYSLVESYFLEHQFNRGPAEFVRKLVRLDELEISGELIDSEQFVGLLKDCKYLRSLVISAPFMEQRFFDSVLSEHCSVIESLTVKNTNQLNFDFLLKFSDLQNFTTEQQLSAKLVRKMFDRFEFLKTLFFGYKGSSVEIHLYDGSNFKLRLDGVRYLHRNLNDLLKCLDLNHNLEVLTDEAKLDNFILKQISFV